MTNSKNTYSITKKNGQVETVDENTALSIKEISDIIKFSTTKIRYDISIGKVTAKKDGITKIVLKEALRYRDQELTDKSKGKIICFNINEAFKFLPSYPRTHQVTNPKKYAGNTVYAIGNNGTVINTNRMNVVRSHITGNGHLQVDLSGINKRNQPEVQQLVALMWCCNALCKSIVHHIDGDKLNNNYKNLIYVSDEQHGKTRVMMDKIKNCKAAGNAEGERIAKEEYYDFIKMIEKENSESFEDLRIIPHLDYEDGKSYSFYMYVTEKSYQLYLQTGNENDLEIKGEGAF